MSSESTKHKTGKVSLSTVILVIILIAGVAVLLYPTVSDYWNSFHETKAIADYSNAVAEMDDTDYDKLFAEAEQYNEELKKLLLPFSEYGELEDAYYRVLDVCGNGIMGYINIEKIGVELPIYHGTSDQVLNKAVGHLEGSSLPIGGESTHCVLSAHRGLPSAKLFTNLDKLTVGDTFTVTVLNQIFTYQVDQVLIVEPDQMEALNVVKGEDYLTLLTCTPYGINTHRLLVRGHRVENEAGDIVVRAEAVKIPVHIVMPAIMVPMLLIILIMLLTLFSNNRKQVDLQDLYKDDISMKTRDKKGVNKKDSE